MRHSYVNSPHWTKRKKKKWNERNVASKNNSGASNGTKRKLDYCRAKANHCCRQASQCHWATHQQIHRRRAWPSLRSAKIIRRPVKNWVPHDARSNWSRIWNWNVELVAKSGICEQIRRVRCTREQSRHHRWLWPWPKSRKKKSKRNWTPTTRIWSMWMARRWNWVANCWNGTKMSNGERYCWRCQRRRWRGNVVAPARTFTATTCDTIKRRNAVALIRWSWCRRSWSRFWTKCATCPMCNRFFSPSTSRLFWPVLLFTFEVSKLI